MIRKLLITTLLLLNSSHVYARWATLADANIEFIHLNNNYVINADGTSEYVRDMEYKILNESGRTENSVKTIYYNKSASSLEILKSKTRVNGREYNLSADLIEDKPIASSVSGFDQINQVLLAFPNVKVGAHLLLSDKHKIIKPDIAGLFESYLIYGGSNIKNSVTYYKSELPLYLHYNDPNKYLDIKQGKDGKYYTIKVTLKRPIYIAIADERSALLSPKKYPWIYVSTFKNWQEYSSKISLPFAQVMQQPLPDMYKTIANTASVEKDPIKKITTVMALLNDNVQYMGDWQTSDGRYAPRDLAHVADIRLGDCKDFATGTAAILNSIGIKATVALVLRGDGGYDYSYLKLPGSTHFNHAMVKVSLGTKDLWVDPTNFAMVADKILPDISDREVLVLYAKNPKLEHIPPSDASESKTITLRTIDLVTPSLVYLNGSTDLEGLAAKQFTGAELTNSSSSIEHYVLSNQGSVHNMIDQKTTLPLLKSRIVEDLNFKFEFKEYNKVMSTNAGHAIFFAGIPTDNYIFNDQVSDMYLGMPRTIREVTTLRNIEADDMLDLNCVVASPWIDAKRTVTYGKDSAIVEQEFKIKQSFISNEVLQSPEFKEFSKDLVKNFKEGVSIVFLSKNSGSKR